MTESIVGETQEEIKAMRVTDFLENLRNAKSFVDRVDYVRSIALHGEKRFVNDADDKTVLEGIDMLAGMIGNLHHPNIAHVADLIHRLCQSVK